MKAICAIISGAGFMLVILGTAGADSQSVLIPVTMITSGAVMIGVSAGWKEKWTEK